MSYLFKWQSISFVSRALAMAIGIVQSIVIVNVLVPSDWGVIRIVASIASFIGVSQAVGLTSGSTREISSAKTNSEAFKVFITALFVRVTISLPFALFLFFAAHKLAGGRESSDLIVWALKVMAIVLVIQSVQGIFNSVLSGFRKFEALFIYQVLIAVLSLLIYLPLVLIYDFKGYFYAYFLFNLLAALILGILSIKNFDRPFPKITKEESKTIFKEIFSISIVVYFAKLLHTFWLESPVLYLNYIVKSDEVVIAVFGFAIFYATKLMVFSDSITDVTLPVMSKSFSEDLEGFKNSYKNNYKKTLLLITFVAAIAAFWNNDLIQLVVKREEYYRSFFIIPLTIVAVWAYSSLNLFKSSVFVPSKKLKGLFVSYVSMVFLVYLSLFLFNQLNYFSVLVNLSIAFAFGTVFAMFLSVYIIKRELNLMLYDKWLLGYVLLSFFYILLYYLVPDIITKTFITLVFCIASIPFFKESGLITTIYSRFKK